jgi:hypothetical protein
MFTLDPGVANSRVIITTATPLQRTLNYHSLDANVHRLLIKRLKRPKGDIDRFLDVTIITASHLHTFVLLSLYYMTVYMYISVYIFIGI